MQHGQESAVAVPDYVLFDFLETEGNRPAARWGHTAVVADHKLIVYGGEGSQAYGDLQVFDPGMGYKYCFSLLRHSSMDLSPVCCISRAN